MTFMAHELIRMIPDSPLRCMAESAIKFDLGSVEDAYSMHKISTRSFFDIPFPVCLFQIDQGLSEILFCLAWRVDEGVMWTAFVLLPGKLMKSRWSTLILSDGRGCVNQMDGADASVAWEDIDKGGQETIATMHTVATSIEVFSCCNVTTIENLPPKFINAKRIAKGKVPFFSYRTLHITPDAGEAQNGKGCGTHASPRLHLRRGHIRRLGDRRVWVRSSLVGDKSKGLALKDYAVKVNIKDES